MFNQKITSLFLAATFSMSAAAYDFQPLVENFSTGSTAGIHFCITAEDFDSYLPGLPVSSQIGCKITNGIVTGSDSSGSLYALPDGTAAVSLDNPSASLVMLTLWSRALRIF